MISNGDKKMKSELKLLIAIVSVILAVGIYQYVLRIDGIQDIEINPEKLLKNAEMLERKAEEIVATSNVSKQLFSRNRVKTATIIYNDSLVEFVYEVGFNRRFVEKCGGYDFIGGRFYKIAVDLKKKKVTVSEADKTQVSEVLGGGLRSCLLLSIGIGLWTPDEVWEFSIATGANAKAGTGSGCFEYDFVAAKLHAPEHFTIDMVEFDYRSKKAWSEKGQWVSCEETARSLKCRATYGNFWSVLGTLPKKANFSYRYHLFVDPDQTVAFRIGVILHGVENGKRREIVHDWIVFVKTPPNPAKLNASELLEFGVETPIWGSCNYHAHGSFVLINRSSMEGLH